MNWPKWIKEYPGLQERMEFIVKRMKDAYAYDEQHPPKKNSEIVKEAQYLQRKFKELEDKIYDLLSYSFWACIPQAKHDELGNPTEYIPAIGNSFQTIRHKIAAIEKIHTNQSSNMKGRIERQYITYIVREAIGHGLEINRKNADRFTALVDCCYINAEINCPDKVDYLLSKVKRETKKNL